MPSVQTAARYDEELRRDYQRLKFRGRHGGGESSDRMEVGGAAVLEAAQGEQQCAAGSHAG
jgi:hypothetical protein